MDQGEIIFHDRGGSVDVTIELPAGSSLQGSLGWGDLRIEIEGHTDSSGPTNVNYQLGLERADGFTGRRRTLISRSRSTTCA
mgnify:CR=1 FL=1